MAATLAHKGQFRVKLAAVIVKGGRVVGVGYNHIKSHPAAYLGESFHAESDAIRKARARNLDGAKMFIYRFLRKDGSLATSKPCEKCMEVIKEAGISAVAFVDEHNEVKYVRVK